MGLIFYDPSGFRKNAVITGEKIHSFRRLPQIVGTKVPAFLCPETEPFAELVITKCEPAVVYTDYIHILSREQPSHPFPNPDQFAVEEGHASWSAFVDHLVKCYSGCPISGYVIYWDTLSPEEST